MKGYCLSTVVDLGSLQVVGGHFEVQVSEVHFAHGVQRIHSRAQNQLVVVRRDLRPLRVPGLDLPETWEVLPE